MSRSSLLGHVLPLVAVMACSSGTSENGSGGQGSGGLASSGGTGSGGVGSGGTAGSSQTGSGGKPGTGGSETSSGGKPGTGGSGTGSVGKPGTGGTSAAPSGGVTSAGGSIGKGGTTGLPGGAGGTSAEGGGAGSTNLLDGGLGAGGRTARDGGPGRDGGAPGGRTGGTGGQSGGTTGTTPTGGTTGNTPCKASPCVILPLGDSITHGFNSGDDAGYRSALFKLIVAANQNVTFIGSLSNGPSTVSNKTFPKNHEGHDGISITGIGSYVPPKKAFSTTPHIVLLHIGTNDMTSNADPTTAANQLDTLVSNIVEGAPDALVLVAKIVPLGYSNTNYNSYIAKIADVVKAHAAKNQNVVMVDMSTLPGSDIRGSGNVHPTDQGYADMANLWYGAIKGYLPN